MTNQYWQHIKSGETYAVQTTDDGTVVSACGPLAQDDVTEKNITGYEFDSDADLVDSLQEHQDDYKLQTWFPDSFRVGR